MTLTTTTGGHIGGKKKGDDRQRAILDVSRTLASGPATAQSFAAIAGIIGEAVGAACAGMWALSVERGAVICVARWSQDGNGQDNGFHVGAAVALHELTDALVHEVFAERQTRCSDAAGDAMRVVVPLLARTGATGYLEVRGRESHLAAQEIEFVEIVAGQVVVALENLRLSSLVERLAPTDKLTGLHNRDHFRERASAEMARAQRYRLPLSVIILDLDHFPSFAERRGRAAADAMLRAVARLLRTGVRDRVDLVCRYRGEQFAIVLPNTPGTTGGAAVVAERLRQAIEKTEFRDDHDEPIGRITVSLGVAGYPDDVDDDEDLIAAAERALKRAHAAGGNRLQLYGAKN